jgi:hypothetical protein
MTTTRIEVFGDNWGYLRTELNWLDQVLMLAVARQRKQTKETDRVAQSRADRVTSHWWKGLVSLDGHIAHDDIRKPAQPTEKSAPKVGYQQQMDSRTSASLQHGIILGLPLLRDRLQLSLFEKNLVLIALAPEINRRYARLYRYLKGEEDSPHNDLPNVDLVLRLLCRNDTEWAQARPAFTPTGTLVRHSLLDVLTTSTDTILNATVRLAAPLVDYLLAERPTVEGLEQLLSASSLVFPLTSLVEADPLAPVAGATTYLTTHPNQVLWEDVIAPDSFIQTLQTFCQRIQAQATVDQDWGFSPCQDTQGVVLLTGATGTGKTWIAQAIATAINSPLHRVDLATVDANDAQLILDEIGAIAPRVLLLQSAQVWFGRNRPLSQAELWHWLTHRCQQGGITILETTRPESILVRWRQVATWIQMPMPDEAQRVRLWQRAFPSHAPLAEELPWDWLAAQWQGSGGSIQAIARAAALSAAAQQSPIGVPHLVQALMDAGVKFKLQAPSLNEKRHYVRSRLSQMPPAEPPPQSDTPTPDVPHNGRE